VGHGELLEECGEGDPGRPSLNAQDRSHEQE
jgi:hypothetical protein